MASTGFNFVLSYSAVEHQSQKEDFLLFDCAQNIASGIALV